MKFDPIPNPYIFNNYDIVFARKVMWGKKGHEVEDITPEAEKIAKKLMDEGKHVRLFLKKDLQVCPMILIYIVAVRKD